MKRDYPEEYKYEFRVVSEDMIEGMHMGETRRYKFKPKYEYSVYTRKTFVGARDINELAKTLSDPFWSVCAKGVWETTRPLAVK